MPLPSPFLRGVGVDERSDSCLTLSAGARGTVSLIVKPESVDVVQRNRVSWTKKPGFLNRISNDARTVKKPGFWRELQKAGIGCINSARIGIVKSNQESILKYHSVFRRTVNSQQSTVNSQQSTVNSQQWIFGREFWIADYCWRLAFYLSFLLRSQSISTAGNARSPARTNWAFPPRYALYRPSLGDEI